MKVLLCAYGVGDKGKRAVDDRYNWQETTQELLGLYRVPVKKRRN